MDYVRSTLKIFDVGLVFTQVPSSLPDMQVTHSAKRHDQRYFLKPDVVFSGFRDVKNSCCVPRTGLCRNSVEDIHEDMTYQGSMRQLVFSNLAPNFCPNPGCNRPYCTPAALHGIATDGVAMVENWLDTQYPRWHFTDVVDLTLGVTKMYYVFEYSFQQRLCGNNRPRKNLCNVIALHPYHNAYRFWHLTFGKKQSETEEGMRASMARIMRDSALSCTSNALGHSAFHCMCSNNPPTPPVPLDYMLEHGQTVFESHRVLSTETDYSNCENPTSPPPPAKRRRKVKPSCTVTSETCDGSLPSSAMPDTPFGDDIPLRNANIQTRPVAQTSGQCLPDISSASVSNCSSSNTSNSIISPALSRGWALLAKAVEEEKLAAQEREMNEGYIATQVVNGIKYRYNKYPKLKPDPTVVLVDKFGVVQENVRQVSNPAPNANLNMSSPKPGTSGVMNEKGNSTTTYSMSLKKKIGLPRPISYGPVKFRSNNSWLPVVDSVRDIGLGELRTSQFDAACAVDNESETVEYFYCPMSPRQIRSPLSSTKNPKNAECPSPQTGPVSASGGEGIIPGHIPSSKAKPGIVSSTPKSRKSKLSLSKPLRMSQRMSVLSGFGISSSAPPRFSEAISQCERAEESNTSSIPPPKKTPPNSA